MPLPDEATLFLPRRLDSEYALTLDLSRPDAPLSDSDEDVVFEALAFAGDGDVVRLGGDPQSDGRRA